MPAFDHCHDQVVRALQKDGWRVVRSPYTIYLPYRYVFADLLVRRENNGNVDQIAIVEIKCFSSNTSTTTELYTAIGQYLVYRTMLSEITSGDPIYLSVPLSIFSSIFDRAVVRTIEEHQIKLIVVDLVHERIIRWIE